MGLAKELRNRRNVTSRKITVQGWADESGKPFIMFAKPITCYDINELQKKHKTILEAPTVAAMVDMIVLKAEDEGGDKLFTSAEDRIDLMGEQTDVISDIANQMFLSVVDAETAEKN